MMSRYSYGLGKQLRLISFLNSKNITSYGAKSVFSVHISTLNSGGDRAGGDSRGEETRPDAEESEILQDL
jgi:hypothetical protein